MTDRNLQIEAMYHLEMASDLSWQVQSHCDEPWVLEMCRRISAALYMVQALGNGPRPGNYQETVDAAREYDAKAAAYDVILAARQGRSAR